MTDLPDPSPPLRLTADRSVAAASAAPLVDAATWGPIVDYVSDHATAAERAAVDAQRIADPPYAAVVASVAAVWALPFETLPAEELDALDAEPALDVDAAWARFVATLPGTTLVASTPSTPATSRRLSRRRLPAWRPSAVVWATLAVVALYLGAVQLDNRYWHRCFYYHAGATAQTVTLPDHSIAVLAPGAYLGTGRSFVHGPRAVYLFGQAHFTVAPDPARPFLVRVLTVQATALGTTFTIAGDTTARVTVNVHTGKVELELLGADGVRHAVAVLTAGQAHQVMALTRWFTRVGYLIGGTGMPFREATRIQAALIRAAAAAVPARR